MELMDDVVFVELHQYHTNKFHIPLAGLLISNNKHNGITDSHNLSINQSNATMNVAKLDKFIMMTTENIPTKETSLMNELIIIQITCKPAVDARRSIKSPM